MLLKIVYMKITWIWKFFLEYQLQLMTGKERGGIKLLIDKIESNDKTHNCCKKKKNYLFLIHCLIHQQNLSAQVIWMNHDM